MRNFSEIEVVALIIRDTVSAELKRLLDADIIERIDVSPWVSPVAVTQHKNSTRIQVYKDFRESNKAIVTDCYPIPHMEELFSELRGTTMCSTIDLANAYYQVPQHEDSRDLSAFITNEGLF